MLGYFFKLCLVVILITNINCMPQFLRRNAGLLDEFLDVQDIFDTRARNQQLTNPAKRNIDINEVFVDQSSKLIGVKNREVDVVQIPIIANVPVNVNTQNTQIEQGPGDINNFKELNQIVDQSTFIKGVDNSKFTGIQAPIVASAPVNVLTHNFQFVQNGDGGDIINQDISNQFFDQSSKLVGVGNRESILAQVPVGAQVPVNILTQNEQLIAGSDGSITNFDLKNQEVDQSSKLKGKDLSKFQLLKAPTLIGGALNILNSNKQNVIGGDTGDQSGGIKNFKGKFQNTDISDTLVGENIRKTDALVLAPQGLLTLTGLNKNSQNTVGGSIENKEINVQKINSDTTITGSNIKKLQLVQVAPQLNIIGKLINKNIQTTGGKDDVRGDITNIILNKQDSSNRISIKGNNTNVFKLLDVDPQILLDLGLSEFSDQKTGGPGSAIHGDITKQKSNSSITMIGDNNSVFRGATVNTQAAVKLRLLELVKQTTGLVSGQLTDEDCEALKNDAIIQEQINDITQIGENNTVTTLAKVGGQLAVDGHVAVKIIQKIRCQNRMTTVIPPTTEPPTNPPTTPTTNPPTTPPTNPPTTPPTNPPTTPPTNPPTTPPTNPPTTPPTNPPTTPPTNPPTTPPTNPPTTPPTNPPTTPPTNPPTTPPTNPPTTPPTNPPTTPPTNPPTTPPTNPPTTPPTNPPTTPPTNPPTTPPTNPPTTPPTNPPTTPPTNPPTTPPTNPPTTPPTNPPTTPPTNPPTAPPTKPPTKPPTTPSRRCYRKYCRKWRKMRYFCF